MSDESAQLGCYGCGKLNVAGASSCADCGLRRGAAAMVWALVPAVLTGALVAGLGHVAGRQISIPRGGGFLDSLLHIVLGTTVPYFDYAFAFIGGWCATVAAGRRRWAAGAIGGTLVALLYVATLVGLHRGYLQVPELLAAFAGLALLGGMLAVAFSAWLGEFTRLSSLMRIVPGGRYLATVVVAALAVVSVLVLYAVLLIAVLVAIVVFAIKLAMLLLGGGKSKPELYIPKGGKIREDGRIVEEGVFFDTETGQRIDEEGRVVQEGLFVDEATGLRIDEDGRVLKEGAFFDTETGVRLQETSSGGREIVKEGLLFDDSTGLSISKSGAAEEDGLLWNSSAGVVIDGEGVHKVHADLAQRGQAVPDGVGGLRIVEPSLLGQRETGVRIDAQGQGYQAGLLGEREVELKVDDAGRVKELR
jgi:hypothetical protein